MKDVFDEIAASVAPLVGSRIVHVRSVCKECEALAKIFSLNAEQTKKLQIAAMLHDVTKCLYLDKQLVICKRYDIDTNVSCAVLHSRTGAYKAREMFPQYVDDEVFDAIWCHTTGKENMTLIEKLLYLADYIEPGRTYEDCVLLRQYFYDGINRLPSLPERLVHLDETLILSFDMTIRALLNDRKVIDGETVRSRNYILSYLASDKTAKIGDNK